MFKRDKPIMLDSELVEKFAKVLRKKQSELTVAEQIFLSIYQGTDCKEYYQAVDNVLTEVGVN